MSDPTGPVPPHSGPVPGFAPSETAPSDVVRYKFQGDQPEMFPDNPVHAVLNPGDEFDGPAGIVHPRLSYSDGGATGGWLPTLSTEASQPPHDPYDFLRDLPEGEQLATGGFVSGDFGGRVGESLVTTPDSAPQPAVAPADTVTPDSPTAAPEAPVAPPVASPNFGSV